MCVSYKYVYILREKFWSRKEQDEKEVFYLKTVCQILKLFCVGILNEWNKKMENFEKIYIESGKESNRRKIPIIGNFSSKNTLLTVSGSNPFIHVEKPATNNLRHCTVWSRPKN
jgi:16S rRNA U1498 N3-methylase RsmE